MKAKTVETLEASGTGIQSKKGSGVRMSVSGNLLTETTNAMSNSIVSVTGFGFAAATMRSSRSIVEAGSRIPELCNF